MKFYLNLGFFQGAPIPRARIHITAPACGELSVENWPSPHIRKATRFRRVALFTLPGPSDAPEIFRLYDPVLTRVTAVYMELTGFEQSAEDFRIQSWILRHVETPYEAPELEHPLEVHGDPREGPNFSGSMAHFQNAPSLKK